MRKTAAVILAAGKSSRMNSKTPKGLHRLWGKTVLDHIIDACFDAGIEDAIVVVGYQADLVKETLGDRVRYALQTEQKGTGHALLCAREAISDDCERLLVLPGDAPLMTGEDLKPILDEHMRENRAATVVSAVLPDAGEYGRIVKKDGILKIVETKGGKAPAPILAIREFNTAVYCFETELVFDALRRVGTDNPQGEYFLTDAIELLSKETGRCEAYQSPDARLWLGVNNRIEMAEAGSILRGRILRDLMLSGVTLADPNAVYIDATVKIGRDTTILPGCILQGETEIGEDCVIGPYAVLNDAKIGDGVTINASQISGSEMRSGSRIGPWSRIRPGCVIGEDARLGNYVELNRTRVGDRVAIGHVSYLGDAEIGEETNIGAGLITCNYDGKRKHPTRIGRKAFIGSHTALVAPVTIGDGAFTAAGSVITEDVPSDALAIGRARQTMKPDWAANRRRKEDP